MSDVAARRFFDVAPIAVVAACAGGLCLWLSRHSPVVTSDSGAYLGVAHNLRHGHGLTVPFNFFTDRYAPLQVVAFHGAVPSTHFPPLYPILLAIVTPPGTALLSAARWLGLTLVLVDVMLVWVLTRRVAGPSSPPLVTAAPAALLVFGSEWVAFHAGVTAESLFLPLSIAVLLALLRAVDARARTRDVTLAVLLAAALFTRYLGLALVATAAIVLVAGTRGSPRARVGRAAAVTVPSLVPIGVFVLWGAAQAHGGESRVLAWHPLRSGWYAFSDMVGKAFLRFEWRSTLQVTFAIAIVVAMVAVVVRWRDDAAEDAPVQRRDLAVLLLFIVVYAVALLGACALFDASTPIDLRLTVPVLAPLFIVTVVVLSRLVARWSRVLASVTAVALVAVVFAVHAADLRDAYRVVSQLRPPPAAALASLGKLPPGVLLTNDPAGAWETTGALTVLLPSSYALTEGGANVHFRRDLCQLAQLARDRPVLVHLARQRLGFGVAQRGQLEQVLTLESLAQSPFDEVWRARPNPHPSLDCANR